MFQRPPQNQHSQLNSQNRMVPGFADLIETEEGLVAEARYVPNRQFLAIPFRSELIHCIP
jgi:hypothetical protein